MAKFCTNCGSPLEDGAKFCTNCGSPLEDGAKFCTNCGTPVVEAPAPAPQAAAPTPPPAPAPAPEPEPAKAAPRKRTTKASAPRQAAQSVPVGYSPRINTPEFAAAVKSNSRSNMGCALVFVFLPLVAFTLYCLITHELEVIYGLFIGGAITFVFLVIFLIVKISGAAKKPWDGTVISQNQRQVRRHKNDHSGPDPHSNWVPEDITVIQRDDGKKHKIVENGYDATAYHYFKVGDRVRFHANMGLLFPYEKYDKSHDTHVVCPFCKLFVDINEDYCTKCGKPLLK